MRKDRLQVFLISFFIITSNYLFSQMSFVDLNPDSCVCVTSANNSYDTLITHWDLDNNGTNDFVIKCIAWYSDAIHNNEFTYIIPLNNNKVAGDSLCQYCQKAFQLNAGDSINGQLSWLSTSPLLVKFLTLQGWQGYWHNPPITFDYVGIKFYSNSILYYGWIKLNADAYNGSAKVIVAEYAYSTSPLIAGEGSITNLNELKSTNLLYSIYPNPSTGRFNLDCPNEMLEGELYIYNSIGEHIYQQKIGKGQNIISLKNLSNGLYSCVIFHENVQISAQKIIIE